MIKQLSRGDVSFSSCQEENWKFFVLLEHLSSYNVVQRATNIKLRANGLSTVGQQLPTLLRVVASVCTSLKVFPVSNIGQQFPRTRNNMQQHVAENANGPRGLLAINVASRLHVASDVCTESPVTLQLTFCHIKKVHHSMLIIGAKQNWWLWHD